MKKSIIALCILPLALFGGEFGLYDKVNADYAESRTNVNVYSYMTDDMWIQYADECIARAQELGITNYVPGKIINPYVKLVVAAKSKFSNKDDMEAFIALYDDKFASAPYIAGPSRTMARYPKTLKKWFDIHPTYKDKCPVEYTQWNKYPTMDSYHRPTPDMLNLYVEFYISGNVVISRIQHIVFSNLVKPIRRKLREEGKSFVVGPDGSNPVQDEIDKFTATLDNPNCAGMKELVLKYFPDYEWIEPRVMTVDEVNELKDKVFYGEIELTESTKLKLRTALGLTEFNRFIDEYNGNK